MDATSNFSDESQREEGSSLRSEVQSGRDFSGSPDGETDSCEHELQLEAGQEDSGLLPEARSRQEGEGLPTGGTGLSVERQDSDSTLGRGCGEAVGEQVDSGSGEPSEGEEVKLSSDVEKLLASITDEARFACGGGKVNREKRMIEGVSLITRGEARGHYMWVDGEMLAQVAQVKGKVKSRFGHPSMFKDDRITIGYIENLRMVNDQVCGDFTLLESASDAPGLGDVAGYLMELAEKCPEMVAMSIAFTRDVEAERAFIMGNLQKGKDGYSYFKSPDKKNKGNFPHARLASLMASDVVDMGAANPGGLFADPSHIGDVQDFVTGKVEGIGKLPAGMLADALVARSNYAVFSAKNADIRSEDNVDIDDHRDEHAEDEVDTFADESVTEGGSESGEAVIESVFEQFADEAEAKRAAAFTVRKSLSQEDADALRAFISSEYTRFDRRTPWERSESNWNLFGAICSAAEARGEELSDDFIATALSVVGFSAEANAIVESLEADAEDEEVGGKSEPQVGSELSLEGLDLNTVKLAIQKAIDAKLAARQGRLV